MPRPSPAPSGPSLRPRRAAALALLLALTGASGAALAQQATPPVPGDRRGWAERRQQEVEAIARFSPSQRREFFNARRSLERRQADQQISLLNGTERCLEQARGAQAVQTCLQQELRQRMQQRRQQRSDLAQLRQRFGLPALPEQRWKGASGGQGSWGPRPAPMPSNGTPQSWQLPSQPYHPLAWY